MHKTVDKHESRSILHVTFNMGIGGTEQVIRQIIENSDGARFRHEILCIDGEIGPLGVELQQSGIHIESVKKRPGTDLKLVKAIHRLIAERDIDVLHCHQYAPYFYGQLGAIFTSAEVVFTEHGRFYPDRHHFKRRFINPVLMMLTSHITAISASTADAVSKYEYIKRKRIQVIYNGIRDISDQDANRDQLLGELGLSADDRYIGTISRLEPIKNQSMMLKAFSIAKKDIDNLKLIIIGDGAKRQDLEELASELSIQDDVIFTGFLNNPQRFISIFEIFLLSSFSEGTSMTLLEAMCLSKPCVVTDVGGNPEIVQNGKTGLVTSSDDVVAFSRSILSLLTSERERERQGNAGRKRFVDFFTAGDMVERYHNLYI